MAKEIVQVVGLEGPYVVMSTHQREDKTYAALTPAHAPDINHPLICTASFIDGKQLYTPVEDPALQTRIRLDHMTQMVFGEESLDAILQQLTDAVNDAVPAENDEEEMLDNHITLKDETGRDIEFEFLDLIEYGGAEYVLLLPADGTSREVIILRVENTGTGDEVAYVSVEDSAVLDAVFAIFRDRYQDVCDFLDD